MPHPCRRCAPYLVSKLMLHCIWCAASCLRISAFLACLSRRSPRQRPRCNASLTTRILLRQSVGNILKGSTGNLGAQAIGQRRAVLERAIKQRSQEDLTGWLDQLAMELPVFIAAVQTAMPTMALAPMPRQPTAMSDTDLLRVVASVRAPLEADSIDARRFFEQRRPVLTDTLGLVTAGSLGKLLEQFLFEEALALLNVQK